MHKGDRGVIFFFLLPAVLLTGVFLYYPFIHSIIKSFYYSDGMFINRFVGIENYIRLAQDEVVKIATLNTLEMMLYAVIFQVGLGIVLALLVDSIRFGKNFFRSVFFFPVAISATAIGLMFTLFYNYDNGMLNQLLVRFGFEKVVWMTEETSLLAVAVPVIWQYVGFYFVIILTAISKIPDDFYEAAQLEGITGLQKTIYITLPLIWGDVKTSILLAITGALKVFELVYVISSGGPANSSEVLGTYMYQKTFTGQAFGYGATIAVWIVILGLLFSVIANRLLKKEEITY
ncbi:sugar ABC transporter permease [Laceyella sacchari]|uniref:Carbohydrate ABC transporter membrane protein 1 (CUT1 family) n=1 Tax=Laceyella sediminis TaxID=573074 RepID=A0ABX5EPP3_9BACL|nr:sugar ABC transporter permease [Laceyella sediminis]AUS08845.1 sugar ABC transporter permease [Laceyella sacchari]PRZ12823.1 carbohydrate ABC transporter membrane protein 1 (CUT1 family) [Laceyella sediminis]